MGVEVEIEAGVIDAILARTRLHEPTAFKISKITKEKSKYTCLLADQTRTVNGLIASQAAHCLDEGAVLDGGSIRALEYVGSTARQDQPAMIGIYKLEVITKQAIEPEPSPAEYSAAAKENQAADTGLDRGGSAQNGRNEVQHARVPMPTEGTPEGGGEQEAGPLAAKEIVGADNQAKRLKRSEEKQEALSLSRAQTVSTPSRLKENAGAFKTPTAKAASKLSGTPGLTPPSTGRKGVQPICSLNPYNNSWTIRAKIVSKTPKRTINAKNGQSYSVFSVTLVDEQGGEIEGTLWREHAENWFDKLEVNKVYSFSKGRVKPANRNYNAARNDYNIDFTNDTIIEECTDLVLSQISVKLSFTRLDSLAPFLGRKALADIVAIVKETEPLGSVKRKSDGEDISRRKLTLVDQSEKMVKLTLWGALAEGLGSELEALENPVITVSSAKVSDYEGVSLDTVQRSAIQINPDIKEAEELTLWFQMEGAVVDFQPAGAGMPSARKLERKNERVWMKDVLKEDAKLPSPDAAPEYFTVRVHVLTIDPYQTPLYYAADPASGKKVVQEGDKWKRADGTPCASMELRYFLRVGISDATGYSEVMLANEQATTLLQCKAGELHELKETDVMKFEEVVKAAQFGEWSFTVKSFTRMYKEELKQRLQAVGKISNSFVDESKLLLTRLKAAKTVL